MTIPDLDARVRMAACDVLRAETGRDEDGVLSHAVLAASLPLSKRGLQQFHRERLWTPRRPVLKPKP